ASRTRIRLDGVPRTVVISAVDRVGNEGAAATVQGPDPIALRPEIIPHSAWEAHPPLGHLADAARRNIAPGDTAMFRDLTVQIASMSADSALVILSQGRGADAAKHDTIVAEQTALTWRGYRIGFLAFNAEPGRLGAGLAELEIAVAATLPLELAASPTTGGAESRLRVPHDIRRLTLHHSGSPEPLLPEDDPTEKLRGLQIWGAAERNWWDVPYHFLIDLEGRIYEGRDYRYMGETNTAYDPRGHLLISVIGNYNRQDATDAQVDAITQLIAWAAAEFGVSPGDIYGHSDFAETSCPGRAFQALLDDGTFARGVADRLAEVSRETCRLKSGEDLGEALPRLIASGPRFLGAFRIVALSHEGVPRTRVYDHLVHLPVFGHAFLRLRNGGIDPLVVFAIESIDRRFDVRISDLRRRAVEDERCRDFGRFSSEPKRLRTAPAEAHHGDAAVRRGHRGDEILHRGQIGHHPPRLELVDGIARGVGAREIRRAGMIRIEPGQEVRSDRDISCSSDLIRKLAHPAREAAIFVDDDHGGRRLRSCRISYERVHGPVAVRRDLYPFVMARRGI